MLLPNETWTTINVLAHTCQKTYLDFISKILNSLLAESPSITFHKLDVQNCLAQSGFNVPFYRNAFEGELHHKRQITINLVVVMATTIKLFRL